MTQKNNKAVLEHDAACEAEKTEEPKRKQPTFGDRLMAVRRAKKLTQKQFADALGIKEIGVGFYEADAALPAGDALKIIGEQFDIDIHELLTGQPAPGLAREITAVRNIKKKFRQILNEVQERAKELKKLDRLIGACIETIELGLDGDCKNGVAEK